jgi:hypothetical protein
VAAASVRIDARRVAKQAVCTAIAVEKRLARPTAETTTAIETKRTREPAAPRRQRSDHGSSDTPMRPTTRLRKSAMAARRDVAGGSPSIVARSHVHPVTKAQPRITSRSTAIRPCSRLRRDGRTRATRPATVAQVPPAARTLVARPPPSPPPTPNASALMPEKNCPTPNNSQGRSSRCAPRRAVTTQAAAAARPSPSWMVHVVAGTA